MNIFRTILLFTCVTAVLAIIGCSDDETDSTTARYLSQTPPGLKAQVFAPGLVSTATARERDVCFSSDFSEFYFGRDNRIMTMHRNGNQWTDPHPAAFGSNFSEYEACLSPDGQRLYFISQRPIGGGDQPEDYQLWTVSRTGEGWGEPERLTDRGDYYPSITSSGVMYFTDRNDDICRTRLVDGRMTEREKLGNSVNTASADYNACIAPDESFLIFSSRGWGDGFGGVDLFISFRSEGDRWTKAQNMGLAINTTAIEYCPALSPDGKYLFFSRRGLDGEDIYWIDAAIIDTLREYDMDVSLDLYHTAVADGLEEMKRRYGQVRDRSTGYRDFDGDLLLGLSDRLLAGGRSGEAVAVLKTCFELHPDAASDLQRLKLALLEDDKPAFDETAGRLRQAAETSPGNEHLTNLLGYQLVGCAKIDEALRVFRLNTEIYPNSGNVFDSYGEALALKGDTAAAIENYRRSLELNPENANAALMLEKLRKE